MRTLTIVLLLCSVAFAEKGKLSAADQKKYKQLLNKGRELENKKKYVEAIAAFDDALKVAKDDATVLTEIGWTAYLAKDYDKAETYTRKALANESTPNIRGAAFYNLGLVQEKRGDRAGAIKSYTESLKARWNATVRGALAKLDPAAAAALDPFKPQALAGPFKSIDDYCKPKRTKPTGDDPETCECSDGKAATGSTKPFEALTWVTRKCEAGDHIMTNYDLAAKVGGSWYVAEVAETDANFHCDNDVDSQTIKIEGGRGVFRLSEHGGCMRGEYSSDFTEDQLVVVGIGSSGKPSATPAIIVGRHEESAELDENGEPKKTTVSVDTALAVTWTKDGLEMKGKTKGGDVSMVGKHALAFP
jgi:hypothetical protein